MHRKLVPKKYTFGLRYACEGMCWHPVGAMQFKFYWRKKLPCPKIPSRMEYFFEAFML